MSGIRCDEIISTPHQHTWHRLVSLIKKNQNRVRHLFIYCIMYCVAHPHWSSNYIKTPTHPDGLPALVIQGFLSHWWDELLRSFSILRFVLYFIQERDLSFLEQDLLSSCSDVVRHSNPCPHWQIAPLCVKICSTCAKPVHLYSDR